MVPRLAQRAAHLEAIHPGQHHIQHDEIAAVGVEPLHGLASIADGVDLVAFGAQVLDHPGREVRIILDHQHVIHRIAHALAGFAARGQCSRNSAPRPRPSLLALTRPPDSCISRCTMNSPKPVP